jgi:ASC-1-like (ASCH) protein
MATSSSSSTKRERTPILEIKFVFGEGRKARWETVQKMFREKIDLLHGDHRSIVANLEQNTTLKCRLLAADEQPAGVMIYSTKLATIHGKDNAMEIPAFYTDDLDTQNGSQDLSTFLLQKALEQARELKATSICLKVDKRAIQAFRFFHQNHFEVIKERDRYSWVCCAVEIPRSSAVSKEIHSNSFHQKQSAYSSSSNANAHEAKKPRVDSSSSSKAPMPPEPRPVASAPVQIPQQMDECPIKLKYFNLIRNGSKTIEGRISSRPFTNWQTDTFVRFKNQAESVVCQVVKVIKYKTFADMLQKEGFRPCLPDVRDLKAAIQVYKDIPGYADKESKYGVLAIHIRVVQ